MRRLALFVQNSQVAQVFQSCVAVKIILLQSYTFYPLTYIINVRYYETQPNSCRNLVLCQKLNHFPPVVLHFVTAVFVLAIPGIRFFAHQFTEDAAITSAQTCCVDLKQQTATIFNGKASPKAWIS